MVSQKEYGLHATHCCKEHGCEYGDEDCPVVTGKIDQCYYCDQCVPPNDDYGQEDDALSPNEQEHESIEPLKYQLKEWRRLVKYLPETDCDRDDVGEIEKLVKIGVACSQDPTIRKP